MSGWALCSGSVQHTHAIDVPTYHASQAFQLDRERIGVFLHDIDDNLPITPTKHSSSIVISTLAGVPVSFDGVDSGAAIMC